MHKQYAVQDKSRPWRVITPMQRRHMSTASLMPPLLTREPKHKFRPYAKPTDSLMKAVSGITSTNFLFGVMSFKS
jgi:hypothetical protein